MKLLRPLYPFAPQAKRLRSLLLIACVFTAFSCSKENVTPPPSTTLRITVKDQMMPVSGALVKLYLSQDDLLNGTGQIESTKSTDANGEVTFTDLSPFKYYWKAEAGCKNNLNNEVSSTTLLTKGITNTATIQVSSTGTLRVVNTTQDPYDVFANGVLVIDNIPAGSTRNLSSAPAGNWNIRVVQQSGYLFTPTVKNYTGSLLCGGTLTTTI